jgi:hypothetical protein
MKPDEKALVNVGWCIARLTSDAMGRANRLTVCSPADGSQEFYSPAESVVIFGQSHIEILRDFLVEHLPKQEQAP